MDISTLKEIIKTSGLGTGKKEEKINRFISTCKRIHKLTQKSTIENIVKGHTRTSIRDSNDEIDNLIKKHNYWSQWKPDLNIFIFSIININLEYQVFKKYLISNHMIKTDIKSSP